MDSDRLLKMQKQEAFPGHPSWYFTDPLGSTRFYWQWDGDGGWNRSDYYPFGGERVILSDEPTHFKFTGKERDPESGLDNFGARYDSSSFGRFMSPDPDNAGASSDNPQSWNAYAYVLNNPINITDPDGLGPDCYNNPNQCIVVTSAAIEPIETAYAQLADKMAAAARDAAQRSHDYLHTAYQALVNSRIACTAAYTAAGALAGGTIGAKAGSLTGAGVGAIAGGGVFDEFTIPGGAVVGGLGLGGYGAYSGGKLGYATGQVLCSSGTGSGGGGGRSGHDKAQGGAPNRQVGDANRVIREGRKFTDSDSGYTVHVSGDRVVITDPSDGDKIVTRFINSSANTQARIQSGKWIPQ